MDPERRRGVGDGLAGHVGEVRPSRRSEREGGRERTASGRSAPPLDDEKRNCRRGLPAAEHVEMRSLVRQDALDPPESALDGEAEGVGVDLAVEAGDDELSGLLIQAQGVDAALRPSRGARP